MRRSDRGAQRLHVRSGYEVERPRHVTAHRCRWIPVVRIDLNRHGAAQERPEEQRIESSLEQINARLDSALHVQAELTSATSAGASSVVAGRGAKPSVM